MYCETSTRIRSPFNITIRVPGRRVVSVRKGLPSTWPRSTAERRRLIGKSGFVIEVECEKTGRARSTRARLLGAAQPRPSTVPHGVRGRPDLAPGP
jgi:hypothetical protein